MLVGGYFIPRRMLRQLDETLARIKGEFGIPQRACVKWNLRDQACEEARASLGSRVDEFRSRLLGELNTLEIRILMALAWKGDPTYRAEAWKCSFEWILQRLCIILDRKQVEREKPDVYPFLDVVFDWLPSPGRVDEYLGVYANAFYNGYSFTRNRLPALREAHACPCLLVTSSRHSPALQIADILVGAVGDFFRWVYTGNRAESVRRYFTPLYGLFHNDRGRTLGMGLIVNSSAQKKIMEKLSELGLTA